MPVVALTAHLQPHHRQQFEEAGCNDWIAKPIDRRVLYQVLEQQLTTVNRSDSLPASVQEASPEKGEVLEEVDDELMAIFLQELEQDAPLLRDARAAAEWDQVRQVAHRIKGLAASFGFPKMTETAAEVQQRIDDGGAVGRALESLLDELIYQIDQVLP